MRRILGWALAGGLLFGLTSVAQAQVNVTVATPYGVSATSSPYNFYSPYSGYSPLVGWSSIYPALYGVSAPNPWPSNYYAGTPGYAPTATRIYSSSYLGYAPTTRAFGTTTYDVYAPGVMGTGYPIYGSSYYGGFGPPYGVSWYRGGLFNRALRW